MLLPRSTGLPGRGFRLLSSRGGRCLLGPSPAPTAAAVTWPARAFGSSAPPLQRRPGAFPKPHIRRRVKSSTPGEPWDEFPDPPPAKPLPAEAPKPPPIKSLLQPEGADDPLDLAPPEAAFGAAEAKFKPQLLSMARDGSSDLAGVRGLPVLVRPDTGDSGSAKGRKKAAADDDDDDALWTFPLRDLAQVVPRPGRVISLLVHDGAYIKPIMSAVQASRDFNQQPQRSPDNELELLLRHEPVRPEELLRRVKDVAQGWRDAVRRERTRHDKLLKERRRSGAVLPDDARKAEKEVQKLQDKAMKAIELEEAAVAKQLLRK